MKKRTSKMEHWIACVIEVFDCPLLYLEGSRSAVGRVSASKQSETPQIEKGTARMGDSIPCMIESYGCAAPLR